MSRNNLQRGRDRAGEVAGPEGAWHSLAEAKRGSPREARSGGGAQSHRDIEKGGAVDRLGIVLIIFCLKKKKSSLPKLSK